MAEFTEVVKNQIRMCETIDDCYECEIGKAKIKAQKGCRDFIMSNEYAAEAEKIIMDWAAAHPEPQYPTWKEWYESTFTDPGRYDDICPRTFMNHKCADIECVDCRNEHIPADIAEKLGISYAYGKILHNKALGSLKKYF